MNIFSCLRRPAKQFTDPEQPLLEGYEPDCVFCNVSSENGFAIEYEDEEMIAFRDRWPRAAEHLLIVPRRHVSTVKALTVSDIPLIEKMYARARVLRPAEDVKLGYHIPPFSSVHHLHLHVLVPPFTTMGKIQYPVRMGLDGGKKWTWFVTPSQVISILEGGGSISVRARPGRKA